MEILIYIVIPCVGSVFLLGGMFYGAYRMSGYAGLPGREDRASTCVKRFPKLRSYRGTR